MNLELLREQLVTPADDFGVTRYRDSPMATTGHRLRLHEPCLSPKRIEQLQLYTSPLLSLYGLYIHTPTRLLLVYCADRMSFAVRKTTAELLDVTSRNSERGELFDQNKQVEGVHYVGEETSSSPERRPSFSQLTQAAIQVPGTQSTSGTNGSNGSNASNGTQDTGTSDSLGSDNSLGDSAAVKRAEDLQLDIRIREEKLDFEIPPEVSDEVLAGIGQIIPLLPIYIGLRQPQRRRLLNRAVKAVDFSKVNYRDILNRHCDQLVLYQNVYWQTDRIQVEVDTGDLSPVGVPIRQMLKENKKGADMRRYLYQWYRGERRRKILEQARTERSRMDPVERVVAERKRQNVKPTEGSTGSTGSTRHPPQRYTEMHHNQPAKRRRNRPDHNNPVSGEVEKVLFDAPSLFSSSSDESDDKKDAAVVPRTVHQDVLATSTQQQQQPPADPDPGSSSDSDIDGMIDRLAPLYNQN